MLGLYILDSTGEPKAAETMSEYLNWKLEHYDDLRVARTDITPDVFVSTVFLGLNHGHGGNGPPILYESMTFGGATDQDCDRYATKEQALAGHAAMVAAAIEANKESV